MLCSTLGLCTISFSGFLSLYGNGVLVFVSKVNTLVVVLRDTRDVVFVHLLHGSFHVLGINVVMGDLHIMIHAMIDDGVGRRWRWQRLVDRRLGMLHFGIDGGNSRGRGRNGGFLL
jgi:hypothetical protein